MPAITAAADFSKRGAEPLDRDGELELAGDCVAEGLAAPPILESDFVALGEPDAGCGGIGCTVPGHELAGTVTVTVSVIAEHVPTGDRTSYKYSQLCLLVLTEILKV